MHVAVSKIKYLMPVRMEKEVVIYNGRLTLCQIVLQLIVVSFLLWTFVHSRAYLVESTAQMTPMAWRSGHPDYDAGVAADGNSPVCSGGNRRQYDFQYSGDQYFVYADNQCVTIPSSERAVKVGNSIIYYPSYFMEEQMKFIYDTAECASMKNDTAGGAHPVTLWTTNKCGNENYNWGGACPTYEYSNGQNSVSLGGTNLPPDSNLDHCTVYVRKNFLIKGVSKQKMEFSHAYEDANPSTLEVEKGKSAWTEDEIGLQEAGGLKVRKILSVVERFVSGKYEEFDCGIPIAGQCRFGPGKTVSLSLGEWAGAAGVNLDDATTVNTAAIGTNTFYPASSKIQKPLLRNTGFELTLQVAYFDTYYLDEDYDFEGVIAKVQVKSNIDWASRLVTDYGNIQYANTAANTALAETRFRYYYGIRFVFKEGSSGKIGHLVIPALIALLAVVAVYMGFVGQVMKVFLTKMLGDTSRNYKRAQQDMFIPDRDGQQTQPAKAIMAAAAFQYLVDKQRAGGFTNHLSDKQDPSYKVADGSPIPPTKGGSFSNQKAIGPEGIEGDHNATTKVNCDTSVVESTAAACSGINIPGVKDGAHNAIFEGSHCAAVSDTDIRYNADGVPQMEGDHRTEDSGATGQTKIVGKPANTQSELPPDPWGASLDADFILDVLRVSFGNQLDEASLTDMAFNVFTSIARQEEFGTEKQVGQGPNADKRFKRMDEVAETPVMHLESFVRAVCRNDPVDLPALINMYDRLDTTSCVETLFGEPLNLTQAGENRKGRRRCGAEGKSDLTSFFG